MNKHIFLSISLLVSSLVLMPGCGDKGLSSLGCGCAKEEVVEELFNGLESVPAHLLKEPLVTFDGKPVVTGADFERNFLAIVEAQPALKDMLPYIPEEQQDQMFGQMAENMALEKLMHRWISDNKIDQTPEFKRNAQRVHEAVDRDMALRAFEAELLKEIVITDDEAKSFYETNRATDPMLQRPPFSSSASGVKAQVVELASEKDARELAAKAKLGGFTQAAKEAKKTVNDLGLVTDNSFIDADVKNKILSASKVPSIEVVKGADDKWRVVQIISRQEAKYADFDTVKDAVKQIITQKRFQEIYTKKMDDLKAQYNVVVNKDYVNKRKPAKPAALETDLTSDSKELAPEPTKAA